MKKILITLLILCVISNSVPILLVSAAPEVTFYVNHDFNSLENGKQITVTNIADIEANASNKQYEILGESYLWKTAHYTSAAPTFTYAATGDTITGEPQSHHNTTGYIRTAGKNVSPKLAMELKDPQSAETRPTSGNLGILYIDLRIKRELIWDSSEINFLDSSGRIISVLCLPNGGSPTHAPRINTAGTSGGFATTTTIANKIPSNWWYYRVVLDFNTKTQTAFIGEALDTLEPFRSDTPFYNFHNIAAVDFYKVIIGNTNKSAFSFDDFKVYSISGVAMPSAVASMTGKIHVGETLSGTYTYSEPSIGEAEGDSVGYWESANDSVFAAPVKMTADIPMKSGQVSEYALTENDRGKYIRFCVIPKSESGTVGHVAVSNPSSAIGIYNIPVVSISPGKTESEINSNWYSAKDFTEAIMQIAPKPENWDNSFPDNEVKTFTGVQIDTGTGFASNKATATGLAPDTEYVYRVGDGVLWSTAYVFKTGAPDSLDFIHTSDSHIGISGNDGASEWANTITKAKEAYPNASLLLASGDQVDHGTEAEFRRYFEPDVLRGLPISATGGSNHDDTISFKNNFNLPNLSSYGSSTSGSDYYFTRGDALFMVLNTNNHSVTTHRDFMRGVVAANPNYKWKFVMLHHSIFSAGDRYPLNGGSYVDTLRKGLSPIFTELSIDAVFMGHDHGYARTYIMNKMIPQTAPAIDEEGRIVNAEGVQYITANSSTGNKYYVLTDPLPDWVLVASQLNKPTFSGISVRGNSMTITTYRTDTMDVIDTVTICKEDAKPLGEADIILSADQDSLTSGGKIQLSLEAKQGSGIDLSGAAITYEATENETLAIDENGKVTLKNAPQTETTLRIWAKAVVAGNTYISNAVTVCAKNSVSDFSISNISLVGKKGESELSIPLDAQSLPDIDTLILQATAVKNNVTDKELVISAGLYTADRQLTSCKMQQFNIKDHLMELETEYPITLEISIPAGFDPQDLHAEMFFWVDILNIRPIKSVLNNQ